MRVDGRGSGKSPGQCEPWSLAEAIDFYDAIEWAAAQPWCNGKVGLSGISYFAINQWFVANLQPPSLKAIIPWEGFADIYRDALYHGGILSVFMTNWFTAHLMHHMLGRASQDNAGRAGRPTRCSSGCATTSTAARLRGAQAQWDKITVPMFTVGNWTGFGLHLRGNTEAFMRAASQHKKLRIHTGIARASVLHRGGPARSAPLLRLLAQGHRQRRDGRAAGEARDPQGRATQIEWRARARMAARAHAVDEVLFRSVAAGGRRGRRQPARWCAKNPAQAGARTYVAHRASARWARPRRPRRR